MKSLLPRMGPKKTQYISLYLPLRESSSLIASYRGT